MRPPQLQLHISTCIVLMFAAGGLFWVNIHSKMSIGWPAVFFLRPNAEWELWIPDELMEAGHWDIAILFFDVLIALAILAATAFLCEWCLRRRRPI